MFLTIKVAAHYGDKRLTVNDKVRKVRLFVVECFLGNADGSCKRILIPKILQILWGHAYSYKHLLCAYAYSYKHLLCACTWMSLMSLLYISYFDASLYIWNSTISRVTCKITGIFIVEGHGMGHFYKTNATAIFLLGCSKARVIVLITDARNSRGNTVEWIIKKHNAINVHLLLDTGSHVRCCMALENIRCSLYLLKF